MKSLSARLLIAVSALLILFFGLAIFALELAFRDSAEQAIFDRLHVQMVMLVSASDTDENGNLTLPDQLPEARFMSPGSGLIGQVLEAEEDLVWRSMSAVGIFLPITPIEVPGEVSFERAVASDGTDMFSYSRAIEWELSTGQTRNYTFSVAESLQPYLDQVRQFRGRLITLFGVLMVLLLASQALVLRWVLSPLRQVEQEIAEIERGDLTELSHSYPSELQGLTQNTNRLIEAERKRLSRYRNTLGNLAHSLKTPLAIVRSALESGQEQGRHHDDVEETIGEQVDRMNDIVGYQLQRAAASGATTLGHQRVPLAELVTVIVESLQKVYADKRLNCHIEAEEGLYVRAEKGDLMEIFGNVLDNAFKWSQNQLSVRLFKVPSAGESARIQFVVTDDGPGIESQDVDRVLRRGQRADETVSGHGIGLSVVRELTELLEGSITIKNAPDGGAMVQIELPA